MGNVKTFVDMGGKVGQGVVRTKLGLAERSPRRSCSLPPVARHAPQADDGGDEIEPPQGKRKPIGIAAHRAGQSRLPWTRSTARSTA